MVKINGKDYDFNGMNMALAVEKLDFKPERIAVELNGEILPKTDYKNTLLKDGDSVEVVSFVGGG